jgi:hypothetical protein
MIHEQVFGTFSTPGFLHTLILANAGSPMMFFGILHALALNAVIGSVESFILTKYKIDHRLGMIVIANYVSMLVGLFLIAPYFASVSGNNDFWGGRTNLGDYNLNGFMAGMATSFIATLLIEFPFFYLSATNHESKRQIINPFLIANLATNFVMFLIYFFINKPG